MSYNIYLFKGNHGFTSFLIWIIFLAYVMLFGSLFLTSDDDVHASINRLPNLKV